MESGGGRWGWIDATLSRPIGRLNAFLLDYEEAFSYRLAGFQVQPEFAFAKSHIRIAPRLAAATWSSDSLAESFAVFGGGAYWNREIGPVSVQLKGEAVHAGDNGYASGAYWSINADVFGTSGSTSVGVGVSQGATPLENETGFHLWASRTLHEKLEVQAQISRPLTDAVYGSPGTLGFSVGGSWRAFHKPYAARREVARVGAAAASTGRMVRFVVKVPRATRVEVSGSFSDWQPIALQRSGDTWSGEIAVEPGTHQYSFLIDGETWYLPPDAVDVIDDGFGRRNATLVVQPL